MSVSSTLFRFQSSCSRCLPCAITCKNPPLFAAPCLLVGEICNLRQVIIIVHNSHEAAAAAVTGNRVLLSNMWLEGGSLVMQFFLAKRRVLDRSINQLAHLNPADVWISTCKALNILLQ